MNTERIQTLEVKWTLQLDDLAFAYLAWKDGSSTLTMTNEMFAVQYIDIYGECCYT